MLNGHQINGAAINDSGSKQYAFEIDEALELSLHVYHPSRRWEVSGSKVTQTIYLCTVGAPDGSGLVDLDLAISSVQARMRDGKPTYLNAVVPVADDDTIDDIQARIPDGRLILYSGVRTIDGDEIVEELINAELDSIRYDKGGRSGSITMIGYVVRATETSKEVEVSGLSTFTYQASGKRRIRCEPSFFLLPGDVAVYGDDTGESLIVGTISLTVGPKYASMDVTEA